MKYVVWNILYCATVILLNFFLRLPVSTFLPIYLFLCLAVCPFVCPSVCRSNSQPSGTPEVHSNSTQHSRLQNKQAGQVAVIYTSPQSRLNFTEAVIAL